MRLVLRVVVALVALLVVVIGIEMIASESGEVVVLETKDASGAPASTRLWVVDEDGRQWLRAGYAQASWLLAIQRDPAVTVERGGTRAAYIAVPDASARARMNARFATKYGWADAYIGALFGRSDATPIRLEPRAP